jgi:hypothetical protein
MICIDEDYYFNIPVGSWKEKQLFEWLKENWDDTLEEKVKQRANITNILNSNRKLRGKKELIEKFIDTTLDGIDLNNIVEEYDKFVEVERKGVNKKI